MSKTKRRVFLLGAGFSVLAGLPLLGGFKEFVMKYLRESRERHNQEFYKEFADVMLTIENKYPKIINNMELFITYLDLSLLDRSFDMFWEDIDNLEIFRMKLSGAIVDAFWWGDLSFLKGAIHQKKRESYNIFYDALEENDTIITFNYDRLVESGLWAQNKWTFLDGYDFLKNKKDFEGNLHKYPIDKPTSSLIKILKLHGSVGWRYDELTERIILEGMPDYLPGYDGLYCEGDNYAPLKHDNDTTCIEPSYIKKYDRPINLHIWQSASKTLKNCEELYIIGYRMPEADSAARLLLCSAISESNVSQITVIDTSKEVRGKYEMLFGDKVKGIKNSFQEWIERGGLKQDI